MDHRGGFLSCFVGLGALLLGGPAVLLGSWVGRDAATAPRYSAFGQA